MEEGNDILGQMLIEEHRLESSDTAIRYKKANIKFNPFPKSGTANILGGDGYIHKLGPVDKEVNNKVKKYILDSLYATDKDSEDKFLSGVIVGDYGSGKTQLLMYVRYVLYQAIKHKVNYRNPYVIYIDNPGVKLAELVGSIIYKIGEENFRKYLWGTIIKAIKVSDDHKERLHKFRPASSLFEDSDILDPYSDSNTISYKFFLEKWIAVLPRAKRSEFQDVIKDIVIESLVQKFHDSIVAEYFFDLVSSDYTSNQTWEMLSSGTSRRLESKYVEIINAVVSLVKDEGYTHFFILVDEFEDITQGRLSKSQVDNYFHNLRTLLDHQRQWCLLFAMTGNALEMLKRVSPPLVDRIAARTINIPALNNERATTVVLNYLNMARVESNDLYPFNEASITESLKSSNYMTRVFLRNCFELVERFISDEESTIINKEFVNKVLA
jgi:hypothetical protein